MFIEKVFGGIWRNGHKGEEYEAELDRWDEQPEDMKPLSLLQAVLICCAYSCQAMKADLDGNMADAWRYTAMGQYWLGIVVGAWSLRKEGGSIGDFARRGADARHAENRSMKAEAIAWFKANRGEFTSKDKAALKISGSVVPVEFATVRDWLKGV